MFGIGDSCAPTLLVYPRCKGVSIQEMKEPSRFVHYIRPVSAEHISWLVILAVRGIGYTNLPRSLFKMSVPEIDMLLMTLSEQLTFSRYTEICDSLRFTRCTVWKPGYLFCRVRNEKVSRLGY